MAPLIRLIGSAVFGALVVLAATPSAAQQKGATEEVTPAEWVVRFANASYRMRLIPDMAAVVKPIN